MCQTMAPDCTLVASLSGTDSASKDIGGKAGLDIVHGLAREGLGQTRLFLTANYDDKWKHTPLSSNVSQMFSGELDQFRQFIPEPIWDRLRWRIPKYERRSRGADVRIRGGEGFQPRCRKRSRAGSLARGGAREPLRSGAIGESLWREAESGSASTDWKDWQRGDEADIYAALNQTHDWSATGLWSLNMPLNQHWSVTFTVSDNYYEIAPRTFNKNYLLPSIGVTFK